MILKAFGILDVKADAYRPPFFMPTLGQATRAFADAANDPQTDISKHPEDYKLVCVGEFDDGSGVLKAYPDFQSLGFAAEYVKKE